MKRYLAISGLIAALALGGCVTERKGRPGLTVMPGRAGSSGMTGSTVAPAAPVVLPPGPVAAPAPGASQNARIVVRVDPLAMVAFDGQVLPLVSPDGRFIAVEQGEAPSWPTMLARPGAEPPNTTKLTVYDLSKCPPEMNAAVVEHPSPLPAGLMLGRACDNRGFLVESPREDGSRWIGRVSWVGGVLEWLVQGDTVNAHAVLTVRGDLVYTRRAVASDVTELIMLTSHGESKRTAEGAYMFPLCTSEKDLVYSMYLSPAGLEVEAVRVVEDPPGSGNFRLGRTFAKALIGKPGDAALAYQVTAPVQNVVVSGRRDEELPAYPLVFFHPDFNRMVAFDTQASSYTLLAPQSIAAIRWSEAPGYLCAAPQGLMFTPEPSRTETKRRPDIRLDSTPYVPRATGDKARPVILFGPSARGPQSKLLVRSVVVSDQPQ